MRITGPLPRWSVLALLAAGGIALMGASHIFENRFFEFTGDIGIALFTAALLAFTIDRWFKEDFAKDVFHAVTGWLAPQEFREEVRRVLSYKMVCERHHLKIMITPLGASCVRALVTMERTVRNITPDTESVRSMLRIDDWGLNEGRSEINECRMELDGKSVEASPVDTGSKPTSSDGPLCRGTNRSDPKRCSGSVLGLIRLPSVPFLGAFSVGMATSPRIRRRCMTSRPRTPGS